MTSPRESHVLSIPVMLKHRSSVHFSQSSSLKGVQITVNANGDTSSGPSGSETSKSYHSATALLSSTLTVQRTRSRTISTAFSSLSFTGKFKSRVVEREKENDGEKGTMQAQTSLVEHRSIPRPSSTAFERSTVRREYIEYKGDISSISRHSQLATVTSPVSMSPSGHTASGLLPACLTPTVGPQPENPPLLTPILQLRRPRHLSLSSLSPSNRNTVRATHYRLEHAHVLVEPTLLRPNIPVRAHGPMIFDPIWLLGIQHAGIEPQDPQLAKRSAAYRRLYSRLRTSAHNHSSTIRSPLSHFQPPYSALQRHESGTNFPATFYADFNSTIWFTYRSNFPPIKDNAWSDNSSTSTLSTLTKSPVAKWTSDSGWGCMLRTSQSMLANTLLRIHLGRTWRKPAYPTRTTDYATYIKILTWFLDTPAPEAPFGIHRMALAGQELGTEVGQWFGPSVAAGAIKSLSDLYPEAGLGVHIASDKQIFRFGVFAASHGNLERNGTFSAWGNRPVLVMICLRLGLSGVNPLYYETVKMLYTFPQSVGIAGGRPSSSYYFIGLQAENLIYLDSHRAQPAVPLRSPPSPSTTSHWRKAFNGSRLGSVQEHYVSAYSTAELDSFHCDRVRKMPLSGLDPSMLLGFLCKDEKDWIDFQERVDRLPHAIFSIQDEPPKWLDDSNNKIVFESVPGALLDSSMAIPGDPEDTENILGNDPLHSWCVVHTANSQAAKS